MQSENCILTGAAAKATAPVWILLSESELFDDSAVTSDVLVLEILEKVTSLTYHLEQSATAVVVLLVDLEMLCEFIDSLGENSDLNLGRTCVAFVGCISCDDFLLNFFL